MKTFAFLPKAGRGRSPGRKHANRRYRRGTDLFRPGLAAGPPSPESLPSVAGEGFGMRQSPFLFPVPSSPPQIRISPPAPVQSSPASLAPGLDRRTGMAWIRWAWPGRSRGLAGPAVPLHTHHQIPTVVHTQQHLGRLPRAAGVFDRHPATGAFIRQAPHPTARRAEYRHPHAVVLASAIAPHPGIQRHVFIIHIHNAFPSPRRACRGGDIVTLGSISSLCRWKTLRSD